MKYSNIIKKDEKLAEFVGLMLGDGYISYPNCPRIKISFNSITDKEYLQYVKKLVEDIFETKTIIKHRKNENTSNLYIFEKKVIDFVLEEVGLKPSPKWNTAKLPKWIFENKLEIYVLRGLFDTDGSVVITNNNGTKYPRLEIKICPSPMQKQVIEILRRFAFRFGVYDIGKGKVRIQMNGKKQLEKWKELVGFGSDYKRKRAKLDFSNCKKDRIPIKDFIMNKRHEFY